MEITCVRRRGRGGWRLGRWLRGGSSIREIRRGGGRRGGNRGRVRGRVSRWVSHGAPLPEPAGRRVRSLLRRRTGRGLVRGRGLRWGGWWILCGRRTEGWR